MHRCLWVWEVVIHQALLELVERLCTQTSIMMQCCETSPTSVNAMVLNNDVLCLLCLLLSIVLTPCH